MLFSYEYTIALYFKISIWKCSIFIIHNGQFSRSWETYAGLNEIQYPLQIEDYAR